MNHLHPHRCNMKCQVDFRHPLCLLWLNSQVLLLHHPIHQSDVKFQLWIQHLPHFMNVHVAVKCGVNVLPQVFGRAPNPLRDQKRASPYADDVESFSQVLQVSDLDASQLPAGWTVDSDGNLQLTEPPLRLLGSSRWLSSSTPCGSTSLHRRRECLQLQRCFGSL